MRISYQAVIGCGLLLTSLGAGADSGGLAAVQMGMMSSSAPLGATFISSLGSTESTSSSTHMRVAEKDDAALYVATNGAEKRPALENAYRQYIEQNGNNPMDRMEFSVSLLTTSPSTQ